MQILQTRLCSAGLPSGVGNHKEERTNRMEKEEPINKIKEFKQKLYDMEGRYPYVSPIEVNVQHSINGITIESEDYDGICTNAFCHIEYYNEKLSILVYANNDSEEPTHHIHIPFRKGARK